MLEKALETEFRWIKAFRFEAVTTELAKNYGKCPGHKASDNPWRIIS